MSTDERDDRQPEHRRDSRRGFMKKVGVGGALLAVAGAAAPVEALTGAAAAPAARQADALPDSETLATFLMTVEYTGAQLYRLASAHAGLDPAVVTLITKFGDHHQQHGDSYATAISAKDAAKIPNEKLLAERSRKVTVAADQKALLTALADYEDTMAATYLSLIAATTDRTDARAYGDVMAVEVQHAVDLGTKLKQSATTLVPDREAQAAALRPATYAPPTTTATTTTAAAPA
ncbi:MAG: hypothetical protein JWN46_1329 [Acidimicrobiales bacterium]|nr:hypothetical protein [Acidimicrobiales bacterium]